jgi:hypothetical protein
LITITITIEADVADGIPMVRDGDVFTNFPLVTDSSVSWSAMLGFKL